MSNITFLVDSGSDYESFLSKYSNYPIRVIPLHVSIDGKEYLDGETISKNDFYKEMSKAENLPKTSQPTPQRFFEIFNEEIKKGNQVLFISLTSRLSGTFQSADIARNMLDDEEQKNIFLVDSLNVTGTIFLQLLKASSMLENGHTLDEVAKELETYRTKTIFLALLDTLENLKKGGRISSAQAAIGGLLNIKPLITMEEGLIKSLGKSRGRKKGLSQLKELISTKNINKDFVIVVHNFESEETLKEEASVFDLSSYKEVIYLKIGSTIGTYAGPNTIGLVFLEN